MNELALFAGAGGGILGGKLLGWRTVCAVEWDAYARDVLVARQNDGCLEAFPIWDDVQTFDGRPWRGRIDVVSGGFPCQDISAAGKGAGIEGERSGMWKHMARIIGEVLPRFVWVENSPMLVGRGLGVVLADLAQMGYDARWGIVGAHHAGAPHKRDRIWIVGHANSIDRRAGTGRKNGTKTCHASGNVADTLHTRLQGCEWCRETGKEGKSSRHFVQCCCCEDVADSNNERFCRGGVSEGQREPLLHAAGRSRSDKASAARNGREADEDMADAGSERGRLPTEWQLAAVEQPRSDGEARSSGGIVGQWWSAEPHVGRVAHGVAARVDRLRCIGNGQVSAVVPLAWETLTTDFLKP